MLVGFCRAWAGGINNNPLVLLLLCRPPFSSERVAKSASFENRQIKVNSPNAKNYFYTFEIYKVPQFNILSMMKDACMYDDDVWWTDVFFNNVFFLFNFDVKF